MLYSPSAEGLQVPLTFPFEIIGDGTLQFPSTQDKLVPELGNLEV